MTKETKLVWRLNSKPTVDDIIKLRDSKVISDDEAREILLHQEELPKKATPNEIDRVMMEVELLREIVLGLAAKRDTTTIIHKYTPQWNYGWMQPYLHYCSSVTPNLGGSTTITGGLGASYKSSTNAAYSTFTDGANTLLK